MIEKLEQFAQKHPYRTFGIIHFLLSLLFFSGVIFPAEGWAVGGHDMRGLFVPWLELARETVWNGRLPLWDSFQFGGYPFLSNPQVALFYPPTWFAIILPVRIAISIYLLFHIWLAGQGMFRLVRAVGGSWLGSVLSALTFAFCGFFAARIEAGHMGLLAVHSWLPWLLWVTIWAFRRNSRMAAVLIGLPFGLAILAGHTTSLLYVGMIWLAFGLYLWWDNGRSALSILFQHYLIGGLVGLLLSSVQLLPLIQFSTVSSRAAEATLEFATGFSFPPAHLITLLIPTFFGEPTQAGYWSVPNFEELTAYAGVLPLLAIILATRKPSRLSWFYIGLLVFGLLLAFGSYGFLFELIYRFVPPFRLARAPGRAAFLFTFAAAALLGEVVTHWQKDGVQLRPFLHKTLIIITITGLTTIAAIGAVFAAQHPTETSGRLWHQLGGWGQALAILLLSGGLLSAYLAAPRRKWLVVALACIVIADLWLFGFKLVRTQPTAFHPVWQDAKVVIGETNARVLPWGIPIFEQNGSREAGLYSVFGYNALEVGANIALASSVPDPRSSAYDVMGVEFVVSTVPLHQFEDGERPLQLVQQNGSAWVYRRARVLPVARLVHQFEIISDQEIAISRIHQPEFNPKTTVILAEQPDCELGSASGQGQAEIVSLADGRWQIETDSELPALLILAETDYPGWRVMVDGETAVSLTAYTSLRAVCVPAGTHLVEWEFVPTIYLFGGALAFFALMLIGMAVRFGASEKKGGRQ